MKKSAIILGAALVLLGVLALWLVGSTDPKHLNQQEIVVEIPDTFEK